MVYEDFKPTMQMSSRDMFHQRGRVQLPSEEDTSGKMIVAIVIALVVIALLPQFSWFRDLTGITGWVSVLRNLFGH